MKGTIKGTILGSLTFNIHPEGIVIFESKSKGYYEQKPFTFKARLDADLETARTVHVSPHFKPESLREQITLNLPSIWQNHLAMHPSVKFMSDRQIIEKDRKGKVKELKTLIERMEVVLGHAKTILETL